MPLVRIRMDSLTGAIIMIDIDPRLKQLIIDTGEELVKNTGYDKKSLEDLTYEHVYELDKEASRLRFERAEQKRG